MSINQEYQSTEFQVIFRLYQFEFIENEQNHWSSGNNIAKIIASLQEFGLWQWMKYYKVLGKKGIRKLTSVEQIIQETVNFQQGYYSFNDNRKFEDLHLNINLCENSFYITFFITINSLTIYKDKLLDNLINCACSLYTTFNDIAIIGPSMNIKINDLSFKKIYPPRFLREFDNSSVVNCVSKKFFDSHPQEVWNPFYQHDNNKII